MRKFIYIVAIFCVIGCGSTPYSDDYAAHQNNLKSTDKSKDFSFYLVDGDSIDVRGSFTGNNNVAGSNVMYAGDAGLIGLLVQVGIHSASVNSAKNSRMSEHQVRANNLVSDLITSASVIKHNELLGDFNTYLLEELEPNIHHVKVKPIFFSNPKKTQIELRLVAWIDKPTKKKTKKKQYTYRNSFRVYLNDFTKEQADQLTHSDPTFLKETFSNLLQMGMYMLKHDLSGEFDETLKSNNTKAKTFLVGNDKPTAVRGKLIETKCGFDIVKDLRSWLIAMPPKMPKTETENKTTYDLNATSQNCALL